LSQHEQLKSGRRRPARFLPTYQACLSDLDSDTGQRAGVALGVRDSHGNTVNRRIDPGSSCLFGVRDNGVVKALTAGS